MAPVYVVAFVAVLTLDGVLFPLAFVGPRSITVDLLRSGLQTKLVLASSFALPLALFVSVYRPTINLFESTPLHLRDLVLAGPAEMVRRLDRQEQELSLAAHREERSSATVAQIIDSATNTILMALDSSCRITHFNAGAQRLLGWSYEEVRGRLPVMLHDEGFWRRHGLLLGVDPTPQAIIAAHADESAYRDLVLATRAGEPLQVSASTTRILGAQGQLIGYVVAGEEISARLKLQAATLNALQRDQESLERLREVNDFKDSLISTVSHELRTPLASISGYLELLEHGDFGGLSERQLSAVATAGRNSLRLNSLVDSLLTLSRAETGLGQVTLVELDLREVVDGLRPVIDDLATGRAHRIEVTIQMAGTPLLVLGDRASLETVVINLVTNALKFTIGPGAVVIAVENESGPCLVVSDSGIGIAEEEQDRLFTTFFRSSEATRREIPGTGLGLSIISAIIEQHAGSISIESAPGRGTTVRVALPLHHSHAPAAGDDQDRAVVVAPHHLRSDACGCTVHPLEERPLGNSPEPVDADVEVTGE